MSTHICDQLQWQHSSLLQPEYHSADMLSLDMDSSRTLSKKGGRGDIQLCPFYKKNNGATIGHYKLKTVVEIYLIDATRNFTCGRYLWSCLHIVTPILWGRQAPIYGHVARVGCAISYNTLRRIIWRCGRQQQGQQAPVVTQHL